VKAIPFPSSSSNFMRNKQQEQIVVKVGGQQGNGNGNLELELGEICVGADSEKMWGK
jgi:hypothetical protein